MRRSLTVLRGAKGYSWYSKYQQEGAKGFLRHTPPTPFDWEGTSPTSARPRAYFDVTIDEEKAGRIEFELAQDVVPKTVDNFCKLVEGKAEKVEGYKGSKILKVHAGNAIMGGDVENGDGTGNHAAGSERFIKDENFIIPHSGRGLLSMASVGKHTGGSQFYISLGPNDHMNGRCVVFGRVVQGEDIIESIEKIFSFRGTPARPVVIEDCGILE
jgi:cyclophilin family peptidyl-prolyl cis-trans isomerase